MKPMKTNYHTLSVEQLENDVWNQDDCETPMTEKCFRYRRIPLKDLTIEQLRLLIAQNIGLPFLLPEALQVLHENILAEGDYYEGDLLSAVLNVEETFWQNHLQILKLVLQLLHSNRDYVIQHNTVNQHRQLLREMDGFIHRYF
jgi:hypothetical protein